MRIKEYEQVAKVAARYTFSNDQNPIDIRNIALLGMTAVMAIAARQLLGDQTNCRVVTQSINHRDTLALEFGEKFELTEGEKKILEKPFQANPPIKPEEITIYDFQRVYLAYDTAEIHLANRIRQSNGSQDALYKVLRTVDVASNPTIILEWLKQAVERPFIVSKLARHGVDYYKGLEYEAAEMIHKIQASRTIGRHEAELSL